MSNPFEPNPLDDIFNSESDAVVPTPVKYTTTTSFEDMIQDVGDAPEYMTWVVYGKNGSGKTTFGASGDKTLVAEIESFGTFSVSKSAKGKVKKVPIKTWADFEELYWFLKNNPNKFKIVVLDTLTRLQELCIREIVLGDKAKDSELMKEVIRITLQQRGDIAQKMVFWLNAFNNLPIHKVWLCQEAGSSEDLDVKEYEAYPDLTRKIRIYVCSDATVIGRTMVKTQSSVVEGVVKNQAVYVMSTAPAEGYLVKDRSNVLGRGAVNPKIDELITKVYKK